MQQRLRGGLRARHIETLQHKNVAGVIEIGHPGDACVGTVRRAITLALVKRRFPWHGMAIDDLPRMRVGILHELKGQVFLE